MELQPPEIFDFPFTPYDIQHDFMTNLYNVIENKKLGIFESPTGTGKSLSIICGAIRWLKDYKNKERIHLENQIKKIELEKEKLAQETTDWLSSQSEEIKLTQQLYSLKIEQNKLSEYDKKLAKLTANKKLTADKKKQWKKKTNESNLIEGSTVDEKLEEEDDILLEEGEPLENIKDELSDEENDDPKYEPIKIYISSRTHSQLSQFVGEIIKSPFGKDIRVVSLASRQNYCINPNVNRLKSMALINERCLDMQNKSTKQSKTDPDGKITKKQRGTGSAKCPYYKQEAIDELKDATLTEVQDIEDIIKTGKILNACPYYASRKAAEDAEVVLIPYNTLLHKATREANGIKLKNNIVIIDEAHNLLEALAQMHNADLNLNQIEHALLQLKCYKQRYNTRFSASNLLCINQLIFVITKLLKTLDKPEQTSNIYTVENFVLSAQIDNYNMFKLVKFCKDSRIAQKIHNYSSKYSINEENKKKPSARKSVQDFLASIENKGKIIQENVTVPEGDIQAKKPVPTNPLLAVISFLQTLTYSYDDGRILVHTSKEKPQCKLQFLLLNPSSNFTDIVKEARTVIVAGGTMKPNAEFRDRLFIGAGATPDRIVEFSCDHIIPPENIMPLIVTKGEKGENLLFNFENRMSMGNNIKSIIQEACKKIKGGIVVFFPSYKYESWVWQQLNDVSFGRPVFREPQDSGAVENILEKYASAIRKPSSSGALMFSVVGGKLSEGLNFSDDLGRCVIVVGLPYANIKALDLKEKMNYLDKTEYFGAGQKFYESLCMKSVNQCIGRAVRHKNDYATVLLLDERYNRQNTKNALPGWIKRSLRVCNFQEAFALIDQFFSTQNKIMPVN